MPLRFWRKNTGPRDVSDQARDQQHHRREARERHQRERPVEHELRQDPHVGDRRRREVDRRHAEHLDHFLVEERQRAHVRDEADVHEVVAEHRHDLVNPALLRDRQREPQLADRAAAHQPHQRFELPLDAHVVERDFAGRFALVVHAHRVETGFRPRPHLGDQPPRRRRPADDRDRLQVVAAAAQLPQHDVHAGLRAGEQRHRHERPVPQPQPRQVARLVKAEAQQDAREPTTSHANATRPTSPTRRLPRHDW